ncbi:MAG TPA: endonuclease III [bacterium]|nr:endonuclease III [bacterium]
MTITGARQHERRVPAQRTVRRGARTNEGFRRPPAVLRRKAARLDRILEAHYGRPKPRARRDAVSTLVHTILSQNTSDVNSRRAFERLRAKFPSWEAVCDAPVETVIEAIRVAGLSTLKGPRIQGVLRRMLAERGRLSLDFLRRWPIDRAKAWLQGFDGVGPKTAAIVLIFGLGRPAFAVDTHVYRVGRRVGLIPAGLSVAAAHDWLEGVIRRERYGPFHLLLVRHGREICGARRPRCGVCPARRACDFYARWADPRSDSVP